LFTKTILSNDIPHIDNPCHPVFRALFDPGKSTEKNQGAAGETVPKADKSGEMPLLPGLHIRTGGLFSGWSPLLFRGA
jgi:hypothetical protein